MAKSIGDIGREILLECVPISLPEIFKNLLEDSWSREYDLFCPVCKTFPCDYQE